MKTIAVKTEHGWADVVAIVRDLQGHKLVVWQDRTGSVGVMPSWEAEIRMEQF